MQPDGNFLRAVHRELVQVGLDHRATGDHALVHVEGEALRRVGVARQHLERDIFLLLAVDVQVRGRQTVVVPHGLQHGVDLHDATHPVRRQRRARARRTGSQRFDVAAEALGHLGKQPVEHQQILRLVTGGQAGSGLRTGSSC